MIHNLAFVNVKPSSKLLKVLVKCITCREAKEWELTPNQFAQLKAKDLPSGTKGDKWYYSCKKKKSD